MSVMIRFSLRCSNEHVFESWFKSNEAYESLGKAGMLSCPACGDSKVEKNMMAPGLGSSSCEEMAKPASGKREIVGTKTPKEKALKDLKKWVERNSEYVGKRFVQEARAIHDGDAPERSIFGEAVVADAVELLEDGVPVLPLPLQVTRKTN